MMLYNSLFRPSACLFSTSLSKQSLSRLKFPNKNLSNSLSSINCPLLFNFVLMFILENIVYISFTVSG